MDEDLAFEAFEELFGSKPRYYFSVEYGRLKEYNAYVIKVYKTIKFKLSKRWFSVSRIIKKGLFQSLLISLFRKSHRLRPRRTIALDVYNDFIRNLGSVVEKKHFDPVLVESFNRVNKEYFNSSLEMPNLRFGRVSFVKLASYDFHNDTITVSSIFKDAPIVLIDFLMYHELLHKKLKFSGSLMRKFHTKRFKDEERLFKNYDNINKELELFVRRMRRKLSGKWGSKWWKS